jgi:hypothetical protein
VQWTYPDASWRRQDRTVFYKYRDLLRTLGFGTTMFDF